MASTLFQYPGGKSHQFERIRGVMPMHECFVEAFGGSGTITFNKQPSEVTVYNELDDDIVHFFTVYREAPGRLVEWLEGVPYSSEVYHDFAEKFYSWEDPTSDVEPPADTLDEHLVTEEDITHGHIQRAGVFFTLRYMQFGAKFHGKSGFGRSKVQNSAATFENAKQRLDEMIGCFNHVTIENLSYDELIPKYDGEDTLWYFDPPYIGTEGYYRESDFDHQKFCKHLRRIEGYWIVSYDEIPEELEEYNISREKSTNFIDSGMKGEGKETVETLVTNYDPNDVRKWSTSGQMGLAEHSWSKQGTNKSAVKTNGNSGSSDGFLEDVFEDSEPSDRFLEGVLDEEDGDDDGFLEGVLEDEQDNSGGFLDDAI